MRVDQVTSQLTVGQLASRTGVRADTIRYYEREGLPAGRASAATPTALLLSSASRLARPEHGDIRARAALKPSVWQAHVAGP